MLSFSSQRVFFCFCFILKTFSVRFILFLAKCSKLAYTLKPDSLVLLKIDVFRWEKRIELMIPNMYISFREMGKWVRVKLETYKWTTPTHRQLLNKMHLKTGSPDIYCLLTRHRILFRDSFKSYILFWQVFFPLLFKKEVLFLISA